MNFSRDFLTYAIFLLFTLSVYGEDWPQFRGLNRDSIWRETRVLKIFPTNGFNVLWRVPIGAGNSSPVVAHGCVYVSDCQPEKPTMWERVHCFDEKTGRRFWTYRYQIDWHPGFDTNNQSGPCATPIVDGKIVFSVGATGHLLALDTQRGTLIWKRSLGIDYNLEKFPDMTSCPLIEGGLLIVLLCGKPGAYVVAFEKHTGKEVWRALDDPPHAFSSPTVISAGGKRQLIVWTPKGVTSLNPATGRVWWREELATREDYAVATPVYSGGRLLISGLMFQLDSQQPAVSLLWPENKALSQRVLSHTCMPMILGHNVFAGKIGGRLVCLDANTGKQIWETDKVTSPGNGATIHLTLNGDSMLLFTDEGNLIRARLDGTGYHELSRARLIEPDYQFGNRKVVFAPLAFANRKVFARNNKELICVSLAARQRHTTRSE